MTHVLEYQNYRHFLKDLFFQRTQKDPEYTLSKLAEELGVNTNLLSRVFSEKRGLGSERAQDIAKVLFSTPEEAEHFLDLVNAQHARTKTKREYARKKIIERLQEQNAKLNRSNLSLLNNWLDLAVRQAAFFIDIPVHKKAKELAQYFGLSQSEIDSSLNKLIQAGFLEDTGGRYKPKDLFTLSRDESAGKEAKYLHQQFIKRAAQALEDFSSDQREYSINLMSISKKDLPMAKEEIRKFKNELNKKLTQEEKEMDAVFCLGVQFFDLGKA